MTADIDPSLRSAEPPLDSLDDGFSPPVEDEEMPADAPAAAERTLGAKSPF
jgi:hypothetical protein